MDKLETLGIEVLNVFRLSATLMLFFGSKLRFKAFEVWGGVFILFSCSSGLAFNFGGKFKVLRLGFRCVLTVKVRWFCSVGVSAQKLRFKAFKVRDGVFILFGGLTALIGSKLANFKCCSGFYVVGCAC